MNWWHFGWTLPHKNLSARQWHNDLMADHVRAKYEERFCWILLERNLIKLASSPWLCNLKEFEKPCRLFSLSPHLTSLPSSFSLCHLSGSSVLGTRTSCSGPAGFLSCKKSFALCHSQGGSHLPAYLSFSLRLAQPLSFHSTLASSCYLQRSLLSVHLYAFLSFLFIDRFQMIVFHLPSLSLALPMNLLLTDNCSWNYLVVNSESDV